MQFLYSGGILYQSQPERVLEVTLKLITSFIDCFQSIILPL